MSTVLRLRHSELEVFRKAKVQVTAVSEHSELQVLACGQLTLLYMIKCASGANTNFTVITTVIIPIYWALAVMAIFLHTSSGLIFTIIPCGWF